MNDLDGFLGLNAPQAAPGGPDVSALINGAEKKYGLPDGLLHAVLTKGEKSGARAVSSKGAMGLGQLMPDTARDMGVTDPFDPAQSVDGAGKYLAQQLAAFNNDPKLAVAAYNAGPGNVKKYGGVPPFKETQAYVTRVLGPEKQQPMNDLDGFLSGGASSGTAPASHGFLQDVGAAPATQAQPPIPQGQAPAKTASQSFLSDVGAVKQAPNDFVNAKTGQLLNPAQLKTYQQMMAAGTISNKAGAGVQAAGTMALPYVQTDPSAVPQGPGVYYVDLAGKLQQTPGKPVDPVEGLAMGALRGAAVVGKSISNSDPANLLFPARKSQQDAQWKVANQEYGARYNQNGYAQTGDFAGQLAASAPIMAVGGEVVAPVARAAGPVGNFLLGEGGQSVANPLLRAAARGASLATRGAGEGAIASGLTSAGNDAPLADQLKAGALGGAIGGVGIPGAVGVGRNVGNALTGLSDPLTTAGQGKIVNKFFQDVAEGGPTEINATSDIPGVNRTLSQSTGNVGIAAQERALRAKDPVFNNQYTNMMKANNEARQDFFGKLSGDASTLDALTQQRDTAALPLLKKAMDGKTATTPVKVVALIDDLLSGPAGQRDTVRSALNDVRDKLVTGKGSFQTDPEQLYGIRQAIGDSLSPLTAGTSSDKRLASHELLKVKDELDQAIEQGAPGFKDYLKKYSTLSRPVDEAQYLQSLKLETKDGHMTLGAVDSAIKKIETLRAKPGVNAAKSISDGTLNGLKSLRDDLRAEGTSDAGRGSGSDTMQKAASMGLQNATKAARMATTPLAILGGMVTGGASHDSSLGAGVGLGLQAVGNAVNGIYERKNGEIQNKLISAMLDPQNANFHVNGAGNLDVAALPPGARKVLALPPLVKNRLVPASGLAARNLLVGNAP